MTTVVAHPNIALVKYWGKRDARLNLPAAGSLSVTLGPIHTRTSVRFGQDRDRFELDGEDVTDAKAGAQIATFLDLVRDGRELGGAHVVSANDFPTAAGLASSSSGFAALALAATRAAGDDTPADALSVLARRGSGSAARSIFGGVVRMRAGTREDGADAHAEPVFDAEHWDLRVVVALTTVGAKKVASRDGMNHTAATSPYYDAWIGTVEPAIEDAVAAIAARDFERLALLAEASAMQMHASAIAAVPAVVYWNGATLDTLVAVRRWREEEALPVFFTIDAGPHVKVFTLAGHEAAVEARLRSLPGVRGVLHAGPAGAARVVEDGAARGEADSAAPGVDDGAPA